MKAPLNKSSKETLLKLLAYTRELVEIDEEKFVDIQWQLLSVKSNAAQKIKALHRLAKLGPLYVEEAKQVLEYLANNKKENTTVREKSKDLLSLIKQPYQEKSRPETSAKQATSTQPKDTQNLTPEAAETWFSDKNKTYTLGITPIGNTHIVSDIPLSGQVALVIGNTPLWKGQLHPTTDFRGTRSITKNNQAATHTYILSIDSSSLSTIISHKKIDFLVGNQRIHLSKK